MLLLTDRVVIVTGASSGIGAATVRRLARGGARLALLARRADRLEALAKEIDPSGVRVLTVEGDVTLDAVRRRLVDETLEKFGRIDALVNNAGYGTRGPVETVPVDLVRRNFETNVFAPIALTQLVVPHMRERGAGRIVNIGSVAGRVAKPLSSIYDSTKHALEAIDTGLRGELKPWGIDVVLIRPGLILSEFIATADRISPTPEQTGPYEPFFSCHLRGDKAQRWAGSGDDIALLVEKALTAERPRPYYAGPGHAHLFLLLNWLLPVRALDWIVRPRQS